MARRDQFGLCHKCLSNHGSSPLPNRQSERGVPGWYRYAQPARRLHRTLRLLVFPDAKGPLSGRWPDAVIVFAFFGTTNPLQSKMNAAVSPAGSDILKLNARVNLLSALLSHARQELEQQKSAFQDHLKHRDDRITELDSDNRYRDRIIAELYNDIQHRDRKIAEFDRRIAELDNELQRRGVRLDVLEKQLQEQKSAEANKMTLAAIMQSTSWRITAPLRAVGRAVKRAR
jgi:hypothetical protein